MKQFAHTFGKLFKYNQKIIFANKFIYFLISAIAYFFIVSTVALFQNDVFDKGVLFSILLIPGLLIIFYPACFGIQNDQDSKIIEILFGIPNYRYKVWLTRLLMIYIITGLILFALSLISNLLLLDINPFKLVFNLLFPIILCGNIAFLLSTLTRSGSGTAVIMIIIGFISLIAQEAIDHSKWNIFLNPYIDINDINPLIWQNTITSNHIIVAIIAIVCLMLGLLNMQSRERFI